MLFDLVNNEYNAIGILRVIILNISKRQQYLYRWWTVSKLFLLNNGLLCSRLFFRYIPMFPHM